MRNIQSSLLRASFSGLIAVALSLALPSPAHANMVFGTMGPEWFGAGVNSTWVQVKPDAFSPPSDHGLWSLNDLNNALEIAGINPNDARLAGTYSGVVSNINFADDFFNNYYVGSEWAINGTLPPLFTPGDGNSQDDWGVRFTGNINIATAGVYNFGVLADDGFSFALSANGNTYQIFQDGLNPRDRYALPSDLFLQPGQYAFTLNAYDHLEAGVVSLGVWQAPPSTVPSNVPEPAGGALVLLGLGGVAAFRRYRVARLGMRH